ncbi:MAG TPA: hypothetical protein VIM44_03715 [Rariglobus sp.]
MKQLLKVALLLGVFTGICYGWLKFRPTKPVVNKPAVTSVALASPTPATEVAEPAMPEAVVAQPAPEPENLLRTWTSQDGRTMKAEFLSATANDVTVRRDDGRVFTIALAKLSSADADWVDGRPAPSGVITPMAATATSAAQPIPAKPNPPAITQAQIDRIVIDFPGAGKIGGQEMTNDLQELYSKYLSLVKFIRPDTIEANLKMIRGKIADDVKRLAPIAGTSSGDWSGKRGSSQSAAAENIILSARSALAWLQGPLTQHLAAYDALLNPTTR